MKIQINHVLLALEVAGFKVSSFISDAGTCNAKAFKELIDDKEELDLNNTFIPQSSCSMQNPFSPERIVFFMFCTSHILKNLRNALLVSGSHGKRQLRRKGEEMMAWSHIYDCWNRELDRISKGSSKVSRLTADAVEPGLWVKMRVGIAKSIFKRETIAEFINYVCSVLNIPVPHVVPNNSINFLYLDQKNSFLGVQSLYYKLCKYLNLQNICGHKAKEEVQLKQCYSYLL